MEVPVSNFNNFRKFLACILETFRNDGSLTARLFPANKRQSVFFTFIRDTITICFSSSARLRGWRPVFVVSLLLRMPSTDDVITTFRNLSSSCIMFKYFVSYGSCRSEGLCSSLVLYLSTTIIWSFHYVYWKMTTSPMAVKRAWSHFREFSTF